MKRIRPREFVVVPNSVDFTWTGIYDRVQHEITPTQLLDGRFVIAASARLIRSGPFNQAFRALFGMMWTGEPFEVRDGFWAAPASIYNPPVDAERLRLFNEAEASRRVSTKLFEDTVMLNCCDFKYCDHTSG